MQVDTDFMEHPMKLNCSSIASSTPGNNMSIPERDFLKFQQFRVQQNLKTDRTSIGNKKRLTIQINDSYDFQPSQVDTPPCVGIESTTTQNEGLQNNFFKKQQKNLQGNSYCIGQPESQSPSFTNSNSEIDLNQIISYNSFLEQKVKLLEDENFKLKKLMNQQKNENKTLKIQNQSLKITLKKKDEHIFSQRQRIQKLSQKITSLEQINIDYHSNDQRLREKEGKILDLQRKLQKILNMNKAFQKQLKQSDRKIMDLQKDLQKSVCQNHQQAINRIKESSVKVKQMSVKSKQLTCNKENMNANILGNTLGSTVQLRKSIDKKKCSQSQGKKKHLQTTPLTSHNLKGQRTSSTSNIITKKLLVIKKQ